MPTRIVNLPQTNIKDKKKKTLSLTLAIKLGDIRFLTDENNRGE